jgi:nitroimidazol reductase NimA-like FMN-containing flavoprotein (pyridoxamine 5'-phosphate oxidase superfamily)
MMEEFSDPRELLKGLFASQQLAVLATQNEGQPYGNLVAFAETEGLKNLVFVTSRNTRKYANVTEDRRVAMLIDSRRNLVSDFERAVAATAIGAAEESIGEERDVLAKVYAAKHPHLAEFTERPDSAVVKVTVSDYIVADFEKTQSVHLGD